MERWVGGGKRKGEGTINSMSAKTAILFATIVARCDGEGQLWA